MAKKKKTKFSKLLAKYAIGSNLTVGDLMNGDDFVTAYTDTKKVDGGGSYTYLEVMFEDISVVALTKKGFKGKITATTMVVEGNNANKESRLYLTNKVSKTRKVFTL